MIDALVSTIDLPGGSLLPISALRGESVRILRGRVWLTEEGRAGDLFLASGDEQPLAGSGLAVIEALSPARIELITLPSTGLFAGIACAVASAVSRVVRALRQLPRVVARALPRVRADGTVR